MSDNTLRDGKGPAATVSWMASRAVRFREGRHPPKAMTRRQKGCCQKLLTPLSSRLTRIRTKDS
jgi:hypothetical protein